MNENVSVREFSYLDAHLGQIVDWISGIHQDLDRKISGRSLANVVWEDSEDDPYPIPPDWEGGTAQQVLDWNNEADGAAETYYIFASMAGWDSYDNAGSAMRTVKDDPELLVLTHFETASQQTTVPA